MSNTGHGPNPKSLHPAHVTCGIRLARRQEKKNSVHACMKERLYPPDRDRVAPACDRPRPSPFSPSTPPARAMLAAAAPGLPSPGVSQTRDGAAPGVAPRRRRGTALGDGVVGDGAMRRRGLAALARTRSRPSGPHLGLGGPATGRGVGMALGRRWRCVGW
jgi:hypothetical protein